LRSATNSSTDSVIKTGVPDRNLAAAFLLLCCNDGIGVALSYGLSGPRCRMRAQLPCLIANGVSQSRIARTVECAATEVKRDWEPKGRRKLKAARLFEMSIDRSFLAVKSTRAKSATMFCRKWLKRNTRAGCVWGPDLSISGIEVGPLPSFR
jgi:hypothetical protein